MEWYRQHIGLMRQLAEEGKTCACCGQPLIEEGHEQVFALNPEIVSTSLSGLVPAFKLFSVYLVQCQCGEWYHGDCLMPLQQEKAVVVEIRQPNGVVVSKKGTAHSIHCLRCGKTIWEIRGQQPPRWQRELAIRLPHPRERQAEFLRSYELYLRPHMSNWPSFYLRQRGPKDHPWVQYPYPRGGLIPSAEEIARSHWLPDNTKATKHQIAQEICTNEITIKELLSNQIAERERTRTEREHLATAHAVASNQTPDTRHQERETKSGWRGLFGMGKKGN